MSTLKVTRPKRGKAQWCEEIYYSRMDLTRAKRLQKRRRGTLYKEVLYKRYIETRNNYFHLIKQKKQESQNQFLEGLVGEKVYTAIRILKRKKTSFLPPLKNARGRPSTSFKGKCKVLIEGLLPKPTQTPQPNQESYREDINQEQLEITNQEILATILLASKTSTPGED